MQVVTRGRVSGLSPGLGFAGSGGERRSSVWSQFIVLSRTAGCPGRSHRGSSVLRAAVRFTFWGALAMALAAGVGALFGAAL